MFKNYTLIACAFVLCIFTGCKPSISNYPADFSSNSFKNTYKASEAKIYRNDSLLLVNPRWIRFHPDSFIVVQEMGTPYLLKVIDLKSNKIQQVVRKGRGNGEVTVAWGIGVVNNNIWVFDGIQKKIVLLSLNKDRTFSVRKDVYFNDKNIFTAYPLTDSSFVGLTGVDQKSRLLIFNKNGAMVRQMGDFPPIEDSKGVEPNNIIFSSFTTGSPSGNKLALVCSNTDIIEIYDPKVGLLKRMHGPEGIKISVVKKEVMMGTMLTTLPRVSAYWNVIADKKGFWVGYSGYRKGKDPHPKDTDIYPRQIFSFDWTGKPQNKISFDIPLSSFDIDWKSKRIYCLTKNPADEIEIFELNK